MGDNNKEVTLKELKELIIDNNTELNLKISEFIDGFIDLQRHQGARLNNLEDRVSKVERVVGDIRQKVDV